MTKPAQDCTHFHCIEKEVPWEAARKGKTEEGKKKLETKTKSCTELSMASLLTLTVLRSANSTTQMDWTLKLAFKSFTSSRYKVLPREM